MKGLNPYCNGRKNRIPILLIGAKVDVLILIVVEERIGFMKAILTNKVNGS